MQRRRHQLKPGRVSYSPMEQKLFRHLAHGKPITSTVLMERLYKESLSQHFYARETLNSALASLRKKLDFNRAPVKLHNSQLSGPKPKKWWLEKR
jgi:two-component SAPR family response regulator